MQISLPTTDAAEQFLAELRPQIEALAKRFYYRNRLRKMLVGYDLEDLVSEGQLVAIQTIHKHLPSPELRRVLFAVAFRLRRYVQEQRLVRTPSEAFSLAKGPHQPPRLQKALDAQFVVSIERLEFRRPEKDHAPFLDSEMIRDVLDRLCPWDRWLLTARFLRSKSGQQIAKELGCSRQWVSRCVARALERFRKVARRLRYV